MKRIIIVFVLVVVIVAATWILVSQNNFREELATIKVFFNNNNFDPEFSCNKVFPVERSALKAGELEKTALLELLNGPTQSDATQGFFTSINSGVKINNLSIVRGKAMVDFDERLEFQVGGSCRVTAISAQIRETLMQFPNVKEVIISINGRTEDILQP
jgi:spore germination protein GerM